MLGPDAAPGTPEFDLFVKEVVREMTAKAGQKCTAIRRTLVPESALEDVIVGARQATRLDHRRRSGGRWGSHGSAWPGAAQVSEVRKSVDAIARAAELVHGNLDDFAVVGADRQRGAFFPPLLFYARRTAHGAGAARRRSVRTRQHRDAVSHRRRRDRAREEGAGAVWSGPCSRRTTASRETS